MSIFKCKMCGGTIEFESGATIGVCDSCGTKQTLPRLDDDRRANLYDRANHFRRNNEFDKAAGLYEQILNEDPADAEVYWSLVLCRYGIEYVEDPSTHKRVPTVNRTQFTSIFDDEDYKSALQHADGYQRAIYEEEAAAINEIQKGILAISKKEKPFDVFICYKETDAAGRRTQDSVLANDLYHQLTQEGFHVFYARITLEDKLGTAYEPYIFAALNSARVMVVLGTKPEYFNAVWVKNEWSRYLSLVKTSGGKKVLIPCYRDMDPYDLPDEFSHLQALDMSKLGFMQDLIRGIQKIVKADETQATRKETGTVSNDHNIEPLLKRAFMFLEDGDFKSADEYCERVLDQDPENAQAYLGKLMADLKIRRRESLADCPRPFDSNKNYQKAVRFGDENLSSELSGYINHINMRNENARLTEVYNRAVNAMNSANTESAFKAAADIFQTISGFKDADAQSGKCLEKADVCRKDAIYSSARSQMTGEKTDGYETAIKAFSSIPGWKDSDEQIYACQRKIEEIKPREEAERLEQERRAEQKRIAAAKAAKKWKIIRSGIFMLIIMACIAFVIVQMKVIKPRQKMNMAMDLLESGDYEAAYALLEEVGKSNKYDLAIERINAGDYETAYILLNGLDYKDSDNKLDSIKEPYKKVLLSKAQVGSYIIFGSYEQDNKKTNGKEDIEWQVLDKDGNRIFVISRFALDCQFYNTLTELITWEDCSLRKWLNGTFLNAAFSEEEQELIPSVTVKVEGKGKNTTDQVYLLSIPETNRFFSSDEERECMPTDYAVAQSKKNGDSKYSMDGSYFCKWWLRSPGSNGKTAAFVDVSGTVKASWVGDKAFAVRPAMWIDLEE